MARCVRRSTACTFFWTISELGARTRSAAGGHGHAGLCAVRSALEQHRGNVVLDFPVPVLAKNACENSQPGFLRSHTLTLSCPAGRRRAPHRAPTAPATHTATARRQTKSAHTAPHSTPDLGLAQIDRGSNVRSGRGAAGICRSHIDIKVNSSGRATPGVAAQLSTARAALRRTGLLDAASISAPALYKRLNASQSSCGSHKTQPSSVAPAPDSWLQALAAITSL